MSNISPDDWAVTNKYRHFMLDIETLGNTSNAAVVQLGVVAFDPDTGIIEVPYSVDIDPHPKSTMDFSTIKWWMGQSDEAREAVFSGRRVSPEEGLEHLNTYIHKFSDETVGYKVWSKPSTFDLVILENLYRNCGMTQPWAHWNTRCLRTLIDNAKLPRNEEGVPEVAHEAGYDAEAQAKTAIKCFKKLDNGDA